MNESAIEARLAALEARVGALEGERPGRKRLHIMVSLDDVCGIDPQRNSRTCEDASLYRRQQGCLGIACKREASQYWAEYRARAKPSVAPHKKSR